MPDKFDLHRIKFKLEDWEEFSAYCDRDLDEDNNPTDPYPVLTYTPNISDAAEHFHIHLTPEVAEQMHQWLGEYLARRRDNGDAP